MVRRLKTSPRSQRAHLALVETVDEIRQSLKTFNSEAADVPDLARSVVAQTTYWVGEPRSKAFGPSKFVGLKDMTAEKYKRARAGNYEGTIFSGQSTHERIENVLGKEYVPDDALAKKLEEWSRRRIPEHPEDGTRVLQNVTRSKWRFVKLPNDLPHLGEAEVARFRIAEIEESAPECGPKATRGSGRPTHASGHWSGSDWDRKFLGDSGEKFVLGLERRYLRDAGHAALAEKVRWASKKDGDGMGYDIRSISRLTNCTRQKSLLANTGCTGYFSIHRGVLESIASKAICSSSLTSNQRNSERLRGGNREVDDA